MQGRKGSRRRSLNAPGRAEPEAAIEDRYLAARARQRIIAYAATNQDSGSFMKTDMAARSPIGSPNDQNCARCHPPQSAKHRRSLDNPLRPQILSSRVRRRDGPAAHLHSSAALRGPCNRRADWRPSGHDQFYTRYMSGPEKASGDCATDLPSHLISISADAPDPNHSTLMSTGLLSSVFCSGRTARWGPVKRGVDVGQRGARSDRTSRWRRSSVHPATSEAVTRSCC